MPAWWGRKSSTSRKKEEQLQQQQTSTKDKDRKGKDKSKSFDKTLTRISPKNRNNSSSSGFDSDDALEKRGHPLPRPSATDHSSVSSISSSASSDDPPPDLGFPAQYRFSDATNTPRGKTAKADSQRQHIVESRNLIWSGQFPEHRLPDIPASPRNEYHGLSITPNGSTLSSPRASIDIEFNTRSRSPGPASRGHTLPTSPLHSRVSGGFSPGSSMEKQEDGKAECHPLPLPPGSPNSATLRNNGMNENAHFLHSRWRKGKLLGRGTFGHVYVGFNSENGQMCAIKEVKVISDDRNSKECLRQLNQEINLLSQLSHPNIVQYYGSELAEDTLSVYLEYVSAGSIHKLLQEYGSFKEPVIQSYTAQILAGLAYLHERNTVHRDIKGANILVDPNGEIKLADFGMAKHITSCSSVLSFKGSPYWMAPEVIMNCSGYNLAVDIWSLGCTILEMATSKPPWSQYEGVAAIFKIGNSKEIPEIPDHISDDGKSFLKFCLQRDPSARPTAVQLLEHPFVRGQATAKVPRININRDALQSSTDVNYKLGVNRKNNISRDADYGIRHSIGCPIPSKRIVISTYSGVNTTIGNCIKVGMRINLSLPVSPCSSPLRQLSPAHRSCFLSPPPAHHIVGMGGGPGTVNHSVSPRTYTNTVIDTWPDITQMRFQTPNDSPTTRQMQSMCL